MRRKTTQWLYADHAILCSCSSSGREPGKVASVACSLLSPHWPAHSLIGSNIGHIVEIAILTGQGF